jgi:flagellar biosynthesis/type III secretory pathway protein FliH
MAEYKIMLMRLYKIPVRQFVIFLWKSKPKMVTQLVTEDLSFRYNLLAISAISYKTFLNSNKPEEIVLSILANFEKETDSKALEQIIKRLEATTNSELTLEKYFNQLRVLAQLRKLEDKLKDTIMDSIAKYVSIKRDVGYMIGLEHGIEQGIEQGIEKGIEKANLEKNKKFIVNLLTKTDHTFEQIADIVGVTVLIVENVNKEFSCR